MKAISFDCPQCASFQTVSWTASLPNIDVACQQCGHTLKLTALDQTEISQCPVCACDQLHQHKDFNKKLGLAVFVVGAVLIPWTYCLSLLGALAIDAALYPFFPWMQVCYFCKAEIRGFAKNPKLDRFNHETAAHYEYGKKKWIHQKS